MSTCTTQAPQTTSISCLKLQEILLWNNTFESVSTKSLECILSNRVG
jgi:hypothetical protein